MEDIFKLGYPIPKVWLHMEFDFNDTIKYMDEQIVETKEELQRLKQKYLH